MIMSIRKGFLLVRIECKQHNSLVKQHDSLMKQHDALVKQHDSLVKQHDSLVKQHGSLLLTVSRFEHTLRFKTKTG
jgi:hypothetical protein